MSRSTNREVMADAGKWIAGLSPEQPASVAAMLVLRPRLEVVAQYLPLALHQSDQDVEYVHQLRVGTRRSSAAVKLFRDVLPKRWRNLTSETIRSIRRAAGTARDWDVLLDRLQQSPGLKDHPATRDFLIGYTLGQRSAAQDFFISQGSEHEQRLAEVLESIPQTQDADGPTLIEIAEPVLVQLFGSFQEAIDSAPTTAEQLHQLRIEGKRLRYAIEIFASCYSPALREQFYPVLENLQSTLGEIQDAMVGNTRRTALENMLKLRQPALARQLHPGFVALGKELQTANTTHRRQFRNWLKIWTRWKPKHTWHDWLKNLEDHVPRLDEPTGGNGSSKPRGAGDEPSGETTPPRRPAGRSSRSRGNTSGSSRSKSGRGG